MFRSRFTVAVCLVAIAGGVAIGLMPLGAGPGQGVSADLGAGEQVDRMRSNEREDTALPTTTSVGAAGAPSAEVPAPSTSEGVDPAASPLLPVASIPALDWLRRLAPRPAATAPGGLRAADAGGGSDAGAPDQGLTDLGVFSWLAPVTGSGPSSTVAPPAPTSTSPHAPPSTRPPTTVPEVTTTQPEVTTTVPEVTTTEPEVTTTVPGVTVDPPLDPLVP